MFNDSTSSTSTQEKDISLLADIPECSSRGVNGVVNLAKTSVQPTQEKEAQEQSKRFSSIPVALKI